MANSTDINKSALPPLDVARQTFKIMATNRVVPTPDNYERIYNELSGGASKQTLEKAMHYALSQLPHETTEQMKWIQAWSRLLTKENWNDLPNLLSEGMDLSVNFSRQWPDAIRDLLVSWDMNHVGLDNNKKMALLERVLLKFGTDPTLAQKLSVMSKSWREYESISTTKAGIEVVDTSSKETENKAINLSEEIDTELTASNTLINDNGVFDKTPDPFNENFKVLHEVLRQTLKHGLIPRLEGYPELKTSANEIYNLADKAKKLEEWEVLVTQFRQLILKVELIGADEATITTDLLRILSLLIENIGELVADDQWLRGQLAVVQTIISSPLEHETLLNAENSLKNVVYKQGLLKKSLFDTQQSFKSMITIFVDRLGNMLDSTDSYEDVINTFSEKITETDDIVEINQLLENLMRETHTMQADIVRSRDDLESQRSLAQVAQNKVKALETELVSLSEQVRVDQLTGVLNRRGMDEALKREVARVERTGEPLTVALLDIDNFKRLNDTYGHDVGDDALKHLATTVQDTVRPTDIVTRFGGEEFVILLPNTDIDQAFQSITRLQRQLTKKFFMSNNEQLLITFSAGISLYQSSDSEASVLQRADQAMYLSKKTGKNKTMTERDLGVETKESKD